ncbi:MAG TPA: lysophospholipid acyltransferase family protein [Alphaproteobacteria bacterium]
MKRFVDAVRSIFFTIGFYGFTGIMMAVCIPGLYMPMRVKRAISLLWFWKVYMMEKYIMNLDYRVTGMENLPPAPFIIAAKHQSAWETLKVYRIFGDRTAIIAKKGLLDIPVWGRYGRAMGLVPIDRTKGKEAMSDMVKAALEAVNNGRNILVFPQGTRVPVGETRPYKFGIMKLYEGLHVPIVPVALNAGLFWPKNAFFKKSGVITVEILPSIPADLPTEEAFARMTQAIETASDRLCHLPAKV